MVFPGTYTNKENTPQYCVSPNTALLLEFCFIICRMLRPGKMSSIYMQVIPAVSDIEASRNPNVAASCTQGRCSVYLYTCVLCCESNSKNEHDCWWVFKPAAYNRAFYGCRLSCITEPTPWSGTPDLSSLDRAVNQMAELMSARRNQQ